MPSGAERSATRAWIRKGLMSAPAPSVRGVVAVSVWGSVVMSMQLLVDLWDRWSCRCGSLSVRSASVARERRAGPGCHEHAVTGSPTNRGGEAANSPRSVEGQYRLAPYTPLEQRPQEFVRLAPARHRVDPRVQPAVPHALGKQPQVRRPGT